MQYGGPVAGEYLGWVVRVRAGGAKPESGITCTVFRTISAAASNDGGGNWKALARWRRSRHAVGRLSTRHTTERQRQCTSTPAPCHPVPGRVCPGGSGAAHRRELALEMDKCQEHGRRSLLEGCGSSVRQMQASRQCFVWRRSWAISSSELRTRVKSPGVVQYTNQTQRVVRGPLDGVTCGCGGDGGIGIWPAGPPLGWSPWART